MPQQKKKDYFMPLFSSIENFAVVFLVTFRSWEKNGLFSVEGDKMSENYGEMSGGKMWENAGEMRLGRIVQKFPGKCGPHNFAGPGGKNWGRFWRKNKK